MCQRPSADRRKSSSALGQRSRQSGPLPVPTCNLLRPWAEPPATLSRTDGSRDPRFLSQNTAKELVLMRGSRTLSMPFPIRYPQSGGTDMQHLSQRSQRPPVSDPGTHPECSEPEANRTDGTSQALSNFLYWFVASPIQQSVVIRRCPWARCGVRGCGGFGPISLPCLGGSPQEPQVRGPSADVGSDASSRHVSIPGRAQGLG